MGFRDYKGKLQSLTSAGIDYFVRGNKKQSVYYHYKGNKYITASKDRYIKDAVTDRQKQMFPSNCYKISTFKCNGQILKPKECKATVCNCTSRMKLYYYHDSPETIMVQFPSDDIADASHPDHHLNHASSQDNKEEIRKDLLELIALKAAQAGCTAEDAYHEVMDLFPRDGINVMKSYNEDRKATKRAIAKKKHGESHRNIKTMDEMKKLLENDDDPRFLNFTGYQLHQASDFKKSNHDLIQNIKTKGKDKANLRALLRDNIRKREQLEKEFEAIRLLLNEDGGYIGHSEKLLKDVLPSGIVIFTTEEQAKQLADADLLAIDGTFKTTPKFSNISKLKGVNIKNGKFGQMLSIHTIRLLEKDGQQFPETNLVLTALMPDRREKTYRQLFKWIRAYLKEVLGIESIKATCVLRDFECALRNSIDSVLLDNKYKSLGCMFHFNQAVIKKINTLGLKSLLRDNAFYGHVRIILALSMLPENVKFKFGRNQLALFKKYASSSCFLERASVIFFGDKILNRKQKKRFKSRLVAMCSEFFDYFEKTWLNSDARFKWYEWDFFDQPIRTNNGVERWHRGWNRRCPMHGCFDSFLRVLRKEFHRSYRRSLVKRPQPAYRCRRYREKEHALQQHFVQLKTKYKKGEYDADNKEMNEYFTYYCRQMIVIQKISIGRYMFWASDCNLCNEDCSNEIDSNKLVKCNGRGCSRPWSHIVCAETIKKPLEEDTWLCSKCYRKHKPMSLNHQEVIEEAEENESDEINDSFYYVKHKPGKTLLSLRDVLSETEKNPGKKSGKRSLIDVHESDCKDKETEEEIGEISMIELKRPKRIDMCKCGSFRHVCKGNTSSCFVG